ncbi:isoprenylcysteine carboxylmethyltransferase family protein [Sulfurimonas sp.]|uniref:methyltransferase family protein n=1 Tax=Sulfurimonas sp. TaxID=2022749 RepID=UPI00356694C0
MTFLQWIRLVIVYLLIPIMLFISAGDLGWWQAWVYSVLIMVAGVGGRILTEIYNPGLLAERIDVEKLKGAKSWDKILAPLMAISLSYPLVIVAGLDHMFSASPILPVWLSIVGLVLVAVGYSFATWALIENKFFSSVVRIQKERGHKVCDTGPYKIVRHPGYAGNLLALPGMALALNSIWLIIPSLIALIIAIIRTSLEDKILQEELSGYKEYTQRVRYRLIPWIY